MRGCGRECVGGTALIAVSKYVHVYVSEEVGKRGRGRCVCVCVCVSVIVCVCVGVIARVRECVGGTALIAAVMCVRRGECVCV